MSERCSCCGWHSCRCDGSEFRVGEVIVRVDDPEGPRYIVTQCMPGWFAGHRIHKKDPGRDLREHAFRRSPRWYMKQGAERAGI